jgi:hypothetical protein
MEERSFDVELPEVPIKGGSDMENCAEGLKTDCRHGGFVIVDTVTLGKSFRDVADLVPDNLTGVIALSFAYEFAFEGALATWDFGTGDEDEDLKVLETLDFVTGASDPVFMFARRHSMRPRWFVVDVNGRGFKGAIAKGRKNFINRDGRAVKDDIGGE